MSNVKNMNKYKAKALMFNYKRKNYYINNSNDFIGKKFGQLNQAKKALN